MEIERLIGAGMLLAFYIAFMLLQRGPSIEDAKELEDLRWKYKWSKEAVDWWSNEYQLLYEACRKNAPEILAKYYVQKIPKDIQDKSSAV